MNVRKILDVPNRHGALLCAPSRCIGAAVDSVFEVCRAIKSPIGPEDPLADNVIQRSRQTFANGNTIFANYIGGYSDNGAV
jgi:hypothetical protein